MTTCPGNVTISAIATPAGWNGAWRRGTTDSSDVGASRRPARERHQVVDSPLVEAGDCARGDEAGQRHECRRRRCSEATQRGLAAAAPTGRPRSALDVAPIGSPSTSSGSGSAALIATDEDRRSSTLGCARYRPLYSFGDVVAKSSFVMSPIRIDVEEAVVLACVRRELHPATVVIAVRHDHVVHRAFPPDAVLELHHDARVLPGEELARERVVERRPAAECLRHRVGASSHRAAHPGRADVGEEAARAALELDPAEVDRARLAAERDPHGVVEAGREPMRPAEVLARAARQHRKLGLRPRDAVGDLVHGAVAADHHEERPRRVLRRLGEVPRELRQHLLPLQAELGGPLPELRPALPGCAVARGRVDEEERVNRA